MSGTPTTLLPTTQTLLDIARRYAAHPDDWPFAPRYDPRQRWYRRLVADPHAEAWVLTWLPGQGTDLHDHGGSAGAFVVISGTLTERTLLTGTDQPARFHNRVLHAGQARSFGSRHIHQITNHGPQPAVSLHVYGPALREMTRYRLDGTRLQVAATDRAGADW